MLIFIWWMDLQKSFTYSLGINVTLLNNVSWAFFFFFPFSALFFSLAFVSKFLFLLLHYKSHQKLMNPSVAWEWSSLSSVICVMTLSYKGTLCNGMTCLIWHHHGLSWAHMLTMIEINNDSFKLSKSAFVFSYYLSKHNDLSN